jgi:chorismate mutase
MAERIQALRGATTLEDDTREQVVERTAALIREMMGRNSVTKDDLVSIVFTATDDIHTEFPAAAARGMGLGDVPLLCARELDIDGAIDKCIRILMHFYTDLGAADLRHVYLERAKPLRTDLQR